MLPLKQQLQGYWNLVKCSHEATEGRWCRNGICNSSWNCASGSGLEMTANTSITASKLPMTWTGWRMVQGSRQAGEQDGSRAPDFRQITLWGRRWELEFRAKPWEPLETKSPWNTRPCVSMPCQAPKETHMECFKSVENWLHLMGQWFIRKFKTIARVIFFTQKLIKSVVFVGPWERHSATGRMSREYNMRKSVSSLHWQVDQPSHQTDTRKSGHCTAKKTTSAFKGWWVRETLRLENSSQHT